MFAIGNNVYDGVVIKPAEIALNYGISAMFNVGMGK